MTVVVELEGLEIFGRHGVEEEERREGRTFLYDIRLEVSDEAVSDRIENTVDYRDVAACVKEVSGAKQFNLLEALAGTVAEAIADRFAVERVQVRVRKPGPRPAGLAAEYSAATVERASS